MRLLRVHRDGLPTRRIAVPISTSGGCHLHDNIEFISLCQAVDELEAVDHFVQRKSPSNSPRGSPPHQTRNQGARIAHKGATEQYFQPSPRCTPEMVPRRGLEPPTYGLGIRCSVLLSYRGKVCSILSKTGRLASGKSGD